MKGILRIGGAVAFGVIVILGALSMQKNLSIAAQTGEVIVSQEPNRTYVEAKDSDGDGIKDWKEDTLFESINTPTSTLAATESYTPPTTLTGKFSEAFFQDYMEGKMQGEDYTDPTAFIGKAVTAIEANAQSKKHTRLELTIVPDSDEVIHAYGNAVANAIKANAIKNDNEAVILQRALTANDPELLKELEPIREVYENTISDLLALEVPSSFVTEHVAFLDACESILTDVVAMQAAFTDPLYSLARVKGYEVDAQSLFDALKNLGLAFAAGGITYMNDEPGALFYIFSGQ